MTSFPSVFLSSDDSGPLPMAGHWCLFLKLWRHFGHFLCGHRRYPSSHLLTSGSVQKYGAILWVNAYNQQKTTGNVPLGRDLPPQQTGSLLLLFVVAFTPKVQGEENNIPRYIRESTRLSELPSGSGGDLPPRSHTCAQSRVPVAPLPNFLSWKKKSVLLPVKETQRPLRGSCCQRESSRLFLFHRVSSEDPGPGARPDAPWICKDTAQRGGLQAPGVAQGPGQ